MAGTQNAITAKEVERLAKQPGVHRVEHGLYLRAQGNAVSWLGRYTITGKEHWSGYRSYPDVSLAEARAKRDAERVQIRAGVNPVAERKRQRLAKRAEEGPRKTFKQVAETVIADNERNWLNPVHRRQWPATLKTLVYPIIGDMWVDEITNEHVCDVLRPIWYEKPETARRIRGRIEKILDVARVLHLRSGENPARRPAF